MEAQIRLSGTWLEARSRKEPTGVEFQDFRILIETSLGSMYGEWSTTPHEAWVSAVDKCGEAVGLEFLKARKK